MKPVPCEQNQQLRTKIEQYAESLKTTAHQLGDHGLSEQEFYDSGLFRGAIERIRGQFSATMREKRDFVRSILNHLQDIGKITEWESSGNANRHDYSVKLASGKTAVIELKGCLDGNNTNIFDRPHHAQEFIIWSICTNPGADPRHNVWSGIHTRLSAEIIHREQQIDGLILWDMVCGTIGRPCPKLLQNAQRSTTIGQHQLPPPCIYLFPATIPSPRNNPHPPSQKITDVELLHIFHETFKGQDEDINYVDFMVGHQGSETVRKTRILRHGEVQGASDATPIRRR